MKKTAALTILILSLYLGIHRGNLALWKVGDSMPLEVYPYSASLYTKIDRVALEKGMKISSNTDITKLLDDFLS